MESKKIGNMNMVEEKKDKLFFLGIFPKCPFYKPVPLLIILVLIALGTVGIYFLNLWAAVAYLIYSILWYFLVMPIVHCQYCYYKVKETTIDREKGKTIEKLLSVDKWRVSYLTKHVELGPKVTVFMSIVWLLPIILIVISFFLNFSIFALISLISFTIVLVENFYYMLRKVCTTCAIEEECHSSF
jgi:hypothetical protein